LRERAGGEGESGVKGRNLKSLIAPAIAVAFFFILFCGRYLAIHQPVAILMNFDAQSKVIKISLKNESDQAIGFYDNFSSKPDEKNYVENLPEGLCVKVFSKSGQFLSKGTFPDGCINQKTISNGGSITGPHARPMSDLLPRQMLKREVKLKDLVSDRPGVVPMAEYCLQFTFRIYCDPYLQWPVENVSEVTCVNSLTK